MTTTTKLTRLAIRYGMHLTRHIPSLYNRLFPIALQTGIVGTLPVTLRRPYHQTAVIDMATGKILSWLD